MLNRWFESFLDWLERMKPKTRVKVAWGCTIVAVLLVFGMFEGGKKVYHFAKEIITGEWNSSEEDSDSEYSNTSFNHYDFPVPAAKRHPKRMPNYGDDFDFINDVQLVAAKKLGIDPPETREDIEHMKGKLVKLSDTRYYSLLELRSSSPFLVPRAADFLTALGRLMQEYNGTKSRFYISSVLRSKEDVQKLGHINGNATDNSTHSYGTTFDITYSRFDVKGNTTEDQIKLDLARALYDMQSMGYCYVKYERRQPCFHVTVRP